MPFQDSAEANLKIAASCRGVEEFGHIRTHTSHSPLPSVPCQSRARDGNWPPAICPCNWGGGCPLALYTGGQVRTLMGKNPPPPSSLRGGRTSIFFYHQGSLRSPWIKLFINVWFPCWTGDVWCSFIFLLNKMREAVSKCQKKCLMMFCLKN